MLSAVPLRCCYTGNPRCEAAADTETSDCEANIGYLVFYNVVSFSTITESNICALDALLCHFHVFSHVEPFAFALLWPPLEYAWSARARARVCVRARAQVTYLELGVCRSSVSLFLSVAICLSSEVVMIATWASRANREAPKWTLSSARAEGTHAVTSRCRSRRAASGKRAKQEVGLVSYYSLYRLRAEQCSRLHHGWCWILHRVAFKRWTPLPDVRCGRGRGVVMTRDGEKGCEYIYI